MPEVCCNSRRPVLAPVGAVATPEEPCGGVLAPAAVGGAEVELPKPDEASVALIRLPNRMVSAAGADAGTPAHSVRKRHGGVQRPLPFTEGRRQVWKGWYLRRWAGMQ